MPGSVIGESAQVPRIKQFCRGVGARGNPTVRIAHSAMVKALITKDKDSERNLQNRGTEQAPASDSAKSESGKGSPTFDQVVRKMLNTPPKPKPKRTLPDKKRAPERDPG